MWPKARRSRPYHRADGAGQGARSDVCDLVGYKVCNRDREMFLRPSVRECVRRSAIGAQHQFHGCKYLFRGVVVRFAPITQKAIRLFRYSSVHLVSLLNGSFVVFVHVHCSRASLVLCARLQLHNVGLVSVRRVQGRRDCAGGPICDRLHWMVLKVRVGLGCAGLPVSENLAN